MAVNLSKAACVSGTFGIVDVGLIRFLNDSRVRCGRLWAQPRRAMFAPAVGLSDVAYVLGQLGCVDRVLGASRPIRDGSQVLELPAELIDASRRALDRRIGNDDPPPDSCSLEELIRQPQRPLVLVSGCFDLIHAGHVRLIEQAARLGASPVVAMLTTQAIRRQPKNEAQDRPFWTMAERATVLSELRSNPRLLFFDAPDCCELIDTLRPDIYVKTEGDRDRPIVQAESRLVEQLGGRVVWRRREDGLSSTSIAATIRSTVIPPASRGQ